MKSFLIHPKLQIIGHLSFDVAKEDLHLNLEYSCQLCTQDHQYCVQLTLI